MHGLTWQRKPWFEFLGCLMLGVNLSVSTCLTHVTGRVSGRRQYGSGNVDIRKFWMFIYRVF